MGGGTGSAQLHTLPSHPGPRLCRRAFRTLVTSLLTDMEAEGVELGTLFKVFILLPLFHTQENLLEAK